MVRILTDAGCPPLVALCGQSGLRLAPYLHGTLPGDETHLYRVELAESGGFVVVPLTGGETCTPGADVGGVIYCVRSAQSVAKED